MKKQELVHNTLPTSSLRVMRMVSFTKRDDIVTFATIVTDPPPANIDLIAAGYSSITLDWNVEFEGENSTYH